MPKKGRKHKSPSGEELILGIVTEIIEWTNRPIGLSVISNVYTALDRLEQAQLSLCKQQILPQEARNLDSLLEWLHEKHDLNLDTVEIQETENAGFGLFVTRAVQVFFF